MGDPKAAGGPTHTLIFVHTEHFNGQASRYEPTHDDGTILQTFQRNDAKVKRWLILLLKPTALVLEVPQGRVPRVIGETLSKGVDGLLQLREGRRGQIRQQQRGSRRRCMGC